MKTAELAIRIPQEISIRILSGNPNHHLWNNNGTWWCHYTIHRPDFTKQRVRMSLDTCNPREARVKRDAIFAGRNTGSISNSQEGQEIDPSAAGGSK